jgi:putative ABC transport system permease protein
MAAISETPHSHGRLRQTAIDESCNSSMQHKRMRARTLAAIPMVLTLAFRNLFHDRLRLVATIVGIVFSIVLVTVQLGLYVSCERMITAMIDRARADLWIVPMNARSFEDTAMLEGQERFQALATPGVTDAIPLVAGFSEWRKPDGGTTVVIIVGFNADEPGLRPWNFVEGGIDDLATPNGIVIDRSYFKRLGITAVGQYAEIRHQKVRVVAATNLIRSFTTTPFIFTTIERARTFLGAGPSSSTYYLLQVSPEADTDSVRRRLASSLPDAEVITPSEFHDRSLAQWLYGTGAGAALIVGAILGVIVGTVIVAQTLYSSTKDHINEFATLRAIGSSAFYIHKVILCQALLNAVIGFCIAATLGWIIVLATAATSMPVVMTPVLTLGLFVLTVAMCAISAVSAIVKVTRIDPAVVFTR